MTELKKNKAQPATLLERPKLSNLYKIFNTDDRVLIVISADPDAIASALAFKRLLWRKVASVSVARLNEVKRVDNLNLLQFINLKLLPFDQLALDKYTKFVMVDSQPHHNPKTENMNFQAIIDHHPLGNAVGEALARYKKVFFDVRPDYGAVASIMSEYLQQAKIVPNQKLATALFYAIKTDTQNFVRQGQLDDMHSFRWLYPYINHNALSSISQESMSRRSFKHFLAGLNQVKFNKNQAYLFLEKADSADTLVILADFFLTLDKIKRVLVAGVFNDKLIIIFRASGRRQNMGKLANEAFGEWGSAGGHKFMARAEIPLVNLKDVCSTARKKITISGINRFILKQLETWSHKNSPI